MAGPRLAQVICGFASIILGVVAVVLSVVPWLDFATIGLGGIKPAGIGWYFNGVYLTPGLGWAIIVLGLVMLTGGIAAIGGRSTGLILTCGSGAGVLVAAFAAVVGRSHLIFDSRQLGASTPLSEISSLMPALPLLIVVGVAAVGVGIGGTLAAGGGSRSRSRLALGAAIGAGVLVAAIATLVVWISLSGGSGVSVSG
ncbi:hypothetical protein GOARA_052_00040 [Gordonia araii NBRC 100433]|uniref:Uncharacterized protein n=1 Tax=Gordonia araii NBRC 100433 TaxID=1073574 RepID=G7H2N0_9ACTN|nr:hypothetical protein [Gordonia araii]NNG98569.1 hypothetical protein [Gordonia araii NBRC 100433]GAB10105.1 hypothetical protein GOARA_052_00040 [Gordonia araii NBRC 100433]